VKFLARLGKPNTSRRALDERNSEPVFQTANSLADGGAGHAEFVRSAAKAAGFRNSQEDRYAGEIDCHWLVRLTGPCMIGQVVCPRTKPELTSNETQESAMPQQADMMNKLYSCDLTGKVAVVTGLARGIGHATTQLRWHLQYGGLADCVDADAR